MKKLFAVLLLISLMLLSACGGGDDYLLAESSIDFTSMANDPIVELKEEYFLAQLEDIYMNKERYLGKTIKIAGLFRNYYWEDLDSEFFTVYRNSPGCCGNDGQALLEVIWPDGIDTSYPEDGVWVEAVGVLEEYQEDQSFYLRLQLESLEEKEEHGAEFVTK
jgi:Predicted membrane protein